MIDILGSELIGTQIGCGESDIPHTRKYKLQTYDKQQTNMETTIDLSDILAYCAESIEDFKIKEHLALKKIDRERCPFSFCGEFYDEFSECVGEYLLDHDIDEDEFFEEYDIEDVFWAE